MAFKKLRKTFLGVFSQNSGNLDLNSSSDDKEGKKLKREARRLAQEFDKLWKDKSDLEKIELMILVDKIRAKGRNIGHQILLLHDVKELPESLCSCTICWNSYSTLRIPMVGHCGHTICRKCVDAMSAANCPICRKTSSFYMEGKNFLACAFLEHLGKLPEEQEEEPIERGVATSVTTYYAEEEDDSDLRAEYGDDIEDEEPPEWDNSQERGLDDRYEDRIPEDTDEDSVFEADVPFVP